MASAAGTSVGAAPRRKRGPVLHFIGRLFHEKPLGAVCAIIFILFLFCGIFADFLAPYGYNKISPLNRLKPPSWAFPFGTDNLGRDMLSRCLYGAQLSVIIGFCAAGIAAIQQGRCHEGGNARIGIERREAARAAGDDHVVLDAREIGRASCRERV